METLTKSQELMKKYSDLAIKKLKPVIQKNKFSYHLLVRENHKAIYEQKDDEITIAFEAFKVKLGKYSDYQKSLSPTDNDFYESFPKDEDFGKTAWTYRTLTDAMKKYESIA